MSPSIVGGDDDVAASSNADDPEGPDEGGRQPLADAVSDEDIVAWLHLKSEGLGPAAEQLKVALPVLHLC